MAKRLAVNTSFNLIGSAFSYLSTLILLPILIAKMGLQNFGLFSTLGIFAVTGFAQLLELGFQSSVIKYTAEYSARGDSDRANRLAASVFYLFTVMGLALGLVGIFLAPLIPGWLGVPVLEQDRMVVALRYTFASYLFGFPMMIATGLFQGLQRFGAQKSFDVGANLGRFFGWLALLLAGFDYVALTQWSLFVVGVQCIGMYFYLVRFARFDLRPTNFSLEILREIRTMTSWVFIGRFCSFAFTQADRIVISRFLGPSAVGIYETAIRIPSAIKSVLSQLNMTLMPASSSHASQGRDRGYLSNLFVKALNIQNFFTFSTVITLMLVMEPLITLWLGPELVSSVSVARVALLIPLVAPFLNTGSAMLLGANNQLRLVTFITIGAAVMNLIWTLILVRQFGLFGVVWGTVIGLVFSMPFFHGLFTKEFGLPFSTSLGRTAFALALCALAAWGGETFSVFGVASTWPRLIAMGTIVFAVVAGVLYMLLLRPEDRRVFQNFYPRALRKG